MQDRRFVGVCIYSKTLALPPLPGNISSEYAIDCRKRTHYLAKPINDPKLTVRGALRRYLRDQFPEPFRTRVLNRLEFSSYFRHYTSTGLVAYRYFEYGVQLGNETLSQLATILGLTLMSYRVDLLDGNHFR